MRTIASCLLLGLSVNLPSLFAQQDRIAGAINPRSLVMLKGNSNPRARPEFDRGPVDASLHLDGITLNFKPTPAQQSALQQLLQQQQNPASANYHRWLQPEQFADRFGLSPADLAKVAAWAESQGFRVEYQAHTRTFLRLSGSAAQVQNAFHLELRRYQVDGDTHFANASDPSIPAALEPLVSAIRGLDDFYPKPPHRIALPKPDYTEPNGTTHLIVPADLWTIYDMNPLLNAGYNGTGQKLVIVGQSNIDLTDDRLFRSGLGLPANDPQIVLGGSDPGTVASQQLEIDLDLEWAGGIAPNATIIYVYTTSADVAVQYAVDNNLAPVIASSYTECEQLVMGSAIAAVETLAQQANALGITWLAASGDQGAAACDTAPGVTTAINGLAVNVPASVPEVTGVGGTTFTDVAAGYWNLNNNPVTDASALGYIPEVAWNDTAVAGQLNASGGGASALYPKPSWQTGLGVPNDGARDVPDLAFAASPNHDGYVYVYQGAVQSLATGGTSASTAVFAGMMALLNNYLAGNHADLSRSVCVACVVQATTGLGNINPTLYRLSHSSATAFHDITSGSNIVPCALNTPDCTNSNMGWTAGPGYDEVTGLGSIDLANLASQWNTPAGAALTFTAAPSTMIENPGVSNCPFAQYLTLQETNGYAVDLTNASYTSSILNLFGSVRVPPFGSLSALLCWPASTPPGSATLETDGTDSLGNAIAAKTSIAFQGPTLSAGVLAASPTALALSAAASQSASGNISLTVPQQQQWTVTANPSGQESAWLVISPHTGTGPAQIAVTASAASLADGAYSASMVFQSPGASPQYVIATVVFTVGASPLVKISGVSNAASGQPVAAPGMYLSVYGSALAPPGTNLASSTSPLLLSLAGVSATINGIPAAVEIRLAGAGECLAASRNSGGAIRARVEQ
jgi:subtilase family serine protease